MIQQDYFMRLLREFAEALHLLLNKKDHDRQMEEMEAMYNRYIGNSSEFFHTAPVDDVMASFDRFHEDERISRMEMLADLYYTEAGLTTPPSRSILLERALALYVHVDANSRTYSLTRLNKISRIKQEYARRAMP
ncbi:MAG: hypothetical protein K2G86_10595 [Prevotella sp.]|nr:hypothetical protein [Prevotella sp.]